MNECIFFIHIVIVVAFSYIAYRLGKSALVTWITLQAILANLFVLKQITLFSFHVPCSDVFAIGSVLSLNMAQEFFGKSIRKEVILTSFVMLVFFTVLSQIHLFYLPSPFDTMHPAYTHILSSSPRILIASMTSFFLTQLLDSQLFFLLQKTPLPFHLRSAIALSISQAFDTVFFTFLGLYGLIASPSDTILLSYLIKFSMIVILTPLISNRLFRREV